MRNSNGLLQGPHPIDQRPLKIWFEPKQKDGQIICHRRNADGEKVRPIIYTIDSSYPSTSTLEPEQWASWTAARELLGWREKQPTHHR